MRPKARGWEQYAAVALSLPVVRGYAAAFTYWFNVFGHTGPYSQSVEVSIGGSQNVIAKDNPMNSPGK